MWLHRDYKSLPHEEFGSTAQTFEPAVKDFKSTGGFEPAVKDFKSSDGFEPAVKDFKSTGGFEPAVKDFKSTVGFEPALAESKNEYHSSSGRETSIWAEPGANNYMTN